MQLRTFLLTLVLCFTTIIVSHAFNSITDENTPGNKANLEDLVAQFDWKVGEELFYKVKWSVFTLGSLHFRVVKKDSLNGRSVYLCRLFIDSNPSLPFVNIHDIYESYIDEDMYSHAFYSYENKGDHTIYTAYSIDYSQKILHIRIEKWTAQDTLLLLDSTATIPIRIQDSLSLLYFARAMVKNKGKYYVPVFAFNELKYAFINFHGTQKPINNDDSFKGYYLDGRLKFVGIAGIKEDFKGWFSPDLQSVPLRAYMKAFIGSVRIELDTWKNWNPESLLLKALKK